MTTLTEFLEARIAEDEAAARATLIDVDGSGEWRADERPVALTVDLYRVRDINARPVVEAVKSLYGDEGPAEPLYVDGEAIAAHVARHDPVRVLREVTAKRAIIKAHPIDTEYDHMAACRACQWDVDCGAPRDDLEPSDCPCPTLRNLAWTWHTEQGWDMAWCPHHEEDHTEVDHEGPFRAFKRTCRHCQADLGKLLKPRLDGD